MDFHQLSSTFAPVNTFSLLQGKRAAYFTLGCKLNFAETAAISQRLREVGVLPVISGQKADICIINTCSVTEVADHKCRQAIHRMIRRHPGAFVVVIGCYAQLKPVQVAAIEGIDLVLGANEKANLLHYLEERLPLLPDERVALSHDYHTTSTRDITTFVPSCARGERTRYFLKVQDGCDYYCTYCTIPFARGRSRNGSIDFLVSQVQRAAAEGGREVVITGVNIGDYGHSTGESFLDLLRALDEVRGIDRFRISSIEPNLLTDDILEFCASSRAFMPHFHIPLQSGSDEVLRLMHRRYTTDLFARKVERIHQLIPDAFIGVDVIVGTRGETASLFDESERFISALPVSQLHVFSYSERPGTAALRIPHVVSPQEKHERSQRLLVISEHKLRAFYDRFVGHVRPVLLEKSRTPDCYHGYTDNYIKVESHAPLTDNELRPMLLGPWNVTKDALMASLLPLNPHT